MGGLFLSHSTRNLVLVNELASELRFAGYEVWMSEESLHVGQTWREEIVRAIKQCQGVIVVWTPESAQSIHVAREVACALDFDKPIWPLRAGKPSLDGDLYYNICNLHVFELNSPWTTAELVAFCKQLGKLQKQDGLANINSNTIMADSMDQSKLSTFDEMLRVAPKNPLLKALYRWIEERE